MVTAAVPYHFPAPQPTLGGEVEVNFGELVKFLNDWNAGTVAWTAVTTSGDITINTAGGGLSIKEGSNATMGATALIGGAATVSTTQVTATSRIFLTSQADGGAPGFLRVSARNAGADFTITSSSGTDTSTVAWLLIEPAP